MAIRRNARLRREYLYKKSLEGKAKEEYERKERLRVAMQCEYIIIFIYFFKILLFCAERDENQQVFFFPSPSAVMLEETNDFTLHSIAYFICLSLCTCT